MPTESKKFRRDKKSKINAIVEATVALIKERGYSGFSVDEIPDRANLSIGTVYRYFPKGKTDILSEIFNRNAKTLLELIAREEIVEGDFRDFWNKIITAVLSGYREGLIGIPGVEYNLWSNPQYAEIVEPVYSDFIHKLFSQTSGIETFTSLTKNDFISRLSATVGIVNTLVRRHVRMPLFTTDETLVEYLIEVSLLTFEMDQ